MLRVNGELVERELVEEAFARIKAAAEIQSSVSCCGRDEEFHRLAEDEVIDGILLAQEAERAIPEPAASTVRKAFEDTLRKWREHGASWELLEAQRESLRAETISQLRMEKFTSQVWKDLPAPSDACLREWYEENVEQFRTPPAVKVLHLVRFPTSKDPWKDYERMATIRSEAMNGADFEILAKENTQKSGGGVDLGWVELERILNSFESMLFSLREGEVGPVLFYEEAFHLVKVAEIREVVMKSFDEVADQIREEVEREQRLGKLKKVAERLRQTAVVER